MKLTHAASIVMALLLASGCAQYQNTRGVEVTWQASALDSLQRGETTRADVLALFGPPSQVITSGDETALYYLNERSDGTGLVLVVYNRLDMATRYDRAIFFFDRRDRLTDYSAVIQPNDDVVSD